MTPGAYLPIAAEAIKGSLIHELVGSAIPATGSPLGLDLEDATVTFSEDWSPHVQATLTVPAPTDESLYAVLDPLKRCKVQISTGYTYPDNTRDVQTLATLYLTGRGTKRPDNTIELAAASAEALAQAAYLDPWTVPNRAGLTEWVTSLVTFAMYPETPVITSTVGAGYAATEIATIPAAPGDNVWDLIAEAASRTAIWIYADGAGRWIITARPVATGAVAHTVATGPDGTVFSSDAQLSREGFANICMGVYTWREGTTDKLVRGWAAISSGPLAPATAGRVMDVTEGKGPISQAAANTKASSRLANLSTRGRSLLLEAHAAYWLRPSNTITTKLETGPAEDVLVRSVTYAPLAGTMNITTRQALNAPMTIGE
jgi:hypothetical protein